MQIQADPGALKKLRRAATGFQRTFRTPLDRLPSFVEQLLAGEAPPVAATVTIEEVVFTPKNLESLLASYQLSKDITSDLTITATGAAEVHGLLAAALADWIDFFFLSEPKQFLIYADHDEFTTVFAVRKGAISRLAIAMATAGFTEVEGYVRQL